MLIAKAAPSGTSGYGLFFRKMGLPNKPRDFGCCFQGVQYQKA